MWPAWKPSRSGGHVQGNLSSPASIGINHVNGPAQVRQHGCIRPRGRLLPQSTPCRPAAASVPALPHGFGVVTPRMMPRPAPLALPVPSQVPITMLKQSPHVPTTPPGLHLKGAHYSRRVVHILTLLKSIVLMCMHDCGFQWGYRYIHIYIWFQLSKMV